MKKYYPYLITVSHMINDSCQSVLPALLPLFIYTYGLSLEQAGFLILANTALSSLLQPLLGYISDKINQPRLIAFGVLLSACSTGMMGFVTSYESLLVCATLAGVGSSIFHPEGAKWQESEGHGDLCYRRQLRIRLWSTLCRCYRLYSGPTWISGFHRSRYYYIYYIVRTNASHRSSCTYYRPSSSY